MNLFSLSGKYDNSLDEIFLNYYIQLGFQLHTNLKLMGELKIPTRLSLQLQEET